MSQNKIIRAWKDPHYRSTLSESERAALPANPAGSIELSDADLGKVAGGIYTVVLCSKYCNPTVRFSCDCSTAWPKGKPC